jgi:sugar transferase (PEP-CTERM/EpsH1 system associated)
MPFPPNKGDKIRSYNILKYLSSRYVVDIAFLVDDIDDLMHLDELKQMAASVFYDVIRPNKKFFATVSACIGNKPITIPYFYSKTLQSSLDQYFESTIPASIFCFSSPSAEYIFQSKYFVKLKDASRLVMDLIDLDSLKWAQYAERSNRIMAFVYNRESRLLAKYEKKIAGIFNSLLLVSEAEKKLCPLMVQKKVSVVPNGVDLITFAPNAGNALTVNGPVLVFTGAMDYWPNIDAVIWFTEKVFPLILSMEPQAQFYIVGAHPQPEILALRKKDNVVVTGFVEDIRDYIATADICVAPLRIARGIQNKVLEAMAMGKAVVATTSAIEGITADSSRQVMIADTAEAFAEAVLHLLQHKNERDLLGTNARICMESKYSWDNNLEYLNGLFS